MMLYRTVREATVATLKIISNYESEETPDFLIDNKLIRFVIWVLTPAFLLFLILNSTLIHYNIAIYLGLIMTGIFCFILGWLSFKKTLRL